MWAILIIIIVLVVCASKRQQNVNSQNRDRQNQDAFGSQSYQSDPVVRKPAHTSATSGHSQRSYARQSGTKTLHQYAQVHHVNQTSQSDQQKDKKQNPQAASAFRQNQTGASGKSKAQDQPKKAYTRDESNMSEREILKAAGVDADDGAILAAAKVHSFMTELDNDSDSQEDLMQAVYDLMVKGPDTSITFERDFVGEATDMLNSIRTD
mgnify:CR=1 FL=1